MIRYLKDLREKHENLKKRIHAFRLPLSPTGQKLMGFVYFTIPVIVGYYIMQVVYMIVLMINLLMMTILMMIRIIIIN
jgi:hypothetical protein